MEQAETRALSLRDIRALDIEPGAVAAWLFAAFVVSYLAFSNGGYDPIVRDQVGVAVWWVLLCGIGVGALPLPARTRAALLPLALLAGFAVWTALSLSWTESSERTMNELARVLTYGGILVLALSACAAGRARQLLAGATFAVGLVVAIGVLSRLELNHFPSNPLNSVLPGIEIERRLAYPLNYSSAMGAISAMALPLLLGATAWARTLPAQALAAATIPLAGLALFLTSSGTGGATAIVAVGAFFILVPDRLPKLLTALLGLGGTAILAAGVNHRPALDRGLPTPEALSQGDELLLIAIFVCLGVALAQTGIGLALRYGKRPPWLRIEPRQAWVALAVAAVIALPVAIAVGAPGTASDKWAEFKGRGGGPKDNDRTGSLFGASSSGRYQFWQAAADAEKTAPVLGIGPGTFEFWWAQHGSYAGFIRDAHSLYMENFAELGWIGLILIAAFVLAALGIGTTRALRAPPLARVRIATATAAMAGFAMAAALDWVWEMAVIPVLLMLLIAVAGTDRGADEDDAAPADRPARAQSRRFELGVRGAIVATSLVAVIVIALPLAGASDLQASQRAAAGNNLDRALADARDAQSRQPYAATPRLQEALVLEQQGRIAEAAAAAREAADRESLNWRIWVTLSRLEARLGHAQASVAAISTAQSLNPKSALLVPR